MAFLDRLGQVASKVGEVAGDTLDYSKAKGKVVLERGKIKDLKDELGEFVYSSIAESGQLDMDKVRAICAQISEHVENIERLQAEAKESSESLFDNFSSEEAEKSAAGGAEEAEKANSAGDEEARPAGSGDEAGK